MKITKLFILITFALVFPKLGMTGNLVEKKFEQDGFFYEVEVLDNLQYPVKNIFDDQLLLITHASTFWDSSKKSWPSIEKFVTYFDNRSLPYLYMRAVFESPITQKSFPFKIKSERFYPFQGDSHRLNFHGKKVVLTGGNFTICACSTARSLIALSPTADLKIYYPTDGLYEGHQGKFKLISEIVGPLSDKDFIHYLESKYFNDDTLPCKDVTLRVLNRKFSYHIYREGRFIAAIGSPTATRVHLYFDETDKILETLERSE